MLTVFSAPILLGILLGIFFPYQSLALIWLSSFLLFALLFTNTLVVDEKKIIFHLNRLWRPILATQILTFVFFPLVEFAGALALVHDPDFRFGLAVSALAPSALVIPFFATEREGLPELALSNVIVSTLICPLILIPMLRIMGLHKVFIDPRSLLSYLSVLTALPVLVGLLAIRFAPRLRVVAKPFLPFLNSFLLASLMFILVGSAFNRLPSHRIVNQDIWALIGFYLVMDFGVYWLARKLGDVFISPSYSEAIALSVGTRNFAVSAGLMLLFYPRAALPAAVGLVVHAFFFQWLLSTRKRTA